MPSSLFMPQDGMSASLKTMDPIHGIIHEGQHYTRDHYLSVGTGTAVTVMITPPAITTKLVHFYATILTSGAGVLTFSKDPNASGGTTLAGANNNQMQIVNKPDPNVCKHTVTYVSSGTVLETIICNSGMTVYRQLGDGREWILGYNATYLLRFVSDIAANRVNLKLQYYYRDTV